MIIGTDRPLKVRTMTSQNNIESTKSNPDVNDNNQAVAPKIIRQPNIFDATSWSVYCDKNEIISFIIQCFDCQTVEYNREQAKLYFSIVEQKAHKIANFTSYGKGFSVVPNVIDLTNEQNCLLAHILSQDYNEQPTIKYTMPKAMISRLVFSDSSVATIKTEPAGNSFYGNKLLFDLHEFLVKNFPEAPWRFSYSVSYLCPHCQKDFCKSYFDLITIPAPSIVCSNCNKAIVGSSTPPSTKKALNKIDHKASVDKKQDDEAKKDTDEENSPSVLQKVFRFFSKSSD